jgi:hypothetical protein
MPPTNRSVHGRPPEELIRRLIFHGRHLPDAPAGDSTLGDPKRFRDRLRLGGRIDPLRFLPLLEIIRSSPHIPDLWAAPILQGVVDRLRGDPPEGPALPERSGTPAGQPPPAALASTLLEWLTEDSPIWDAPRLAADAIRTVLSQPGPENFFAEPNLDPTPGLLRLAAESDPEIPDGRADAPGGVRGRAAHAAVLLARRRGEAGRPLPPLLENLLFRLAADRHPAVVRSLVQALSELASTSPNLAWRLFRAAGRPGLDRILPAAETFLQTRMGEDRERVRPVLQRLKQAEIALDAEGWASALVHAFRSGEWAGPSLNETLSTLPPETGLAILEKIAPPHGGPGRAGPEALDLPLFIALTEIPAHPAPLADLLMERFSEAAAAETVALDALFRMAYNLLKMLDRTSGTAARSFFFQGLDHLRKRAPRMGAMLLETVRSAHSRF